MSSTIKPFLQRWLITTLAVLVAANVVRGITYDSPVGLLIASLVLGVLNAFLRPLILLLSLPLLILSLGLFTLVINALLLYFVGWVVEPFHVGSFGAAFWGALIISIVSFFANLVLGTGSTKVQVRRGRPSSVPRRYDDSSGPTIDV